jgi:hypothetical protein
MSLTLPTEKKWSIFLNYTEWQNRWSKNKNKKNKSYLNNLKENSKKEALMKVLKLIMSSKMLDKQIISMGNRGII